MDGPPDDTGQPPTNVLPSLLAPPSPALFVTVSHAITMSCSEDEINKKKAYRKYVLMIETSPSAGSVLHPVSFEKILQSANVNDKVKKIGRNCIVLSFLNPTAANTFLCNPLLALKSLRAFIPSINIIRLGLVPAVPSDWSPEKILVALWFQKLAVRILRLQKKHPAIGKSYANAAVSSLSNTTAQKSPLSNSSSSYKNHPLEGSSVSA
ncbi:hypothetical protein EVAR_7403_1 [Eumeta japonica]|uniref:Uncharacterized protein n=1 Tax=Eumeta variegata TaxID=151549 RepID=A0A4C1V6B9_EUMVA|nr:hypothetical protein EVAR_7403_1 [Eumeta japonica]